MSLALSIVSTPLVDSSRDELMIELRSIWPRETATVLAEIATLAPTYRHMHL